MKRSEWADEWWLKALHQLQGAKSLRDSGFWDICAFHCEQAAEMAIKALWIDVKQADPPRTHTIGRLAVDLGAPVDLVQASNDLVGDYMATRYPDASAAMPYVVYEAEDADDRLAKAERILVWVMDHWEPSNDS